MLERTKTHSMGQNYLLAASIWLLKTDLSIGST